MSRSPSIPSDAIICGDNLAVMAGMPSALADLIYADPPFCTGRDFGDFSDKWDSPGDYLHWFHPRLLELRRLLKPTGSIYLHCDPTASHYLKILMDAVFGASNFRNELVWCYERARPAKKQFKRVHDTIMFYSAGRGWNFNPIMVPRKDGSRTDRTFKRPDGTLYRSSCKGKLCPSWWADIPSFGTAMSSRERLGYPTQKPIKLLERIIKASSSEGDLVLDPFCGSGTTLAAAKRLGRRYLGIDSAPRACSLATQRLILSDKEKIKHE